VFLMMSSASATMRVMSSSHVGMSSIWPMTWPAVLQLQQAHQFKLFFFLFTTRRSRGRR